MEICMYDMMKAISVNFEMRLNVYVVLQLVHF